MMKARKSGEEGKEWQAQTDREWRLKRQEAGWGMRGSPTMKGWKVDSCSSEAGEQKNKKKKMEGKKDRRVLLLLWEAQLPAPTGRRRKDGWKRTAPINEAAVPIKSDCLDRLLAVWPEARRSSAPLSENRAVLWTTRATSLSKHRRLQRKKKHKRLDRHWELREHGQGQLVIKPWNDRMCQRRCCAAVSLKRKQGRQKDLYLFIYLFLPCVFFCLS